MSGRGERVPIHPWKSMGEPLGRSARTTLSAGASSWSRHLANVRRAVPETASASLRQAEGLQTIQGLEEGLVVSTTPELERFVISRSPADPRSPRKSTPSPSKNLKTNKSFRKHFIIRRSKQ